jgi:hypothetical protein
MKELKKWKSIPDWEISKEDTERIHTNPKKMIKKNGNKIKKRDQDFHKDKYHPYVIL